MSHGVYRKSFENEDKESSAMDILKKIEEIAKQKKMKKPSIGDARAHAQIGALREYYKKDQYDLNDPNWKKNYDFDDMLIDLVNHIEGTSEFTHYLLKNKKFGDWYREYKAWQKVEEDRIKSLKDLERRKARALRKLTKEERNLLGLEE